MKRDLPGTILRSPGSRFGERVFYCADGQRHWIMSSEFLHQHGFRWPEDINDVPEAVATAFRPGRNAARRWLQEDRDAPPTADPLTLREILASTLHGEGVEFGAGANPLPVPLDCRVRYADLFTVEQLRANFYEGQEVAEIIHPDLHSTFERLDGIDDASVDFLAACHVIEHTTDPIGSLIRAAAKLRPGGSIALVVPDKERTFDRERPTTPLDHLIADYQDPSRERDKADFQEFYKLGFPQPPELYDHVWQSKWEEAYPIHYHTWTYASFGRMIEYIQAESGKFGRVWSHQPDPSAGAIEFYFLLTL